LDGRAFQAAGNGNLYFQSTGPLYLQLRGKATSTGLNNTQTNHVQFQKAITPTPHHRREFPGGGVGGVCRIKKNKEMYEA